MLPAGIALCVALAACSGPAPDTKTDGNMTSAGSVENAVPIADAAANDSSGSNATSDMPDYAGRWIGVEGMYLDVKPAGSPGRYRLEMQWDLDNKGVFEGSAAGDAITFERKGVTETLRPSDGDATGLKYLAGKKDCLTVKSGEGYCRD